jgi:hypothetical protein
MEDDMIVRSLRSERRVFFRARGLLVTVAFVVLVLACGSTQAKSPGKEFSSPQEAVKALVDAVRANDTKSLLTIFGRASKALVLSGDPVEDKEGREKFLKLYEEKNRLEEGPDKVMLYVGSDEWPFPIPIVRVGQSWRFDTKAGKREILARRIGRNELSTIQVCLAYVDAQKEYAMKKGREAQGLLEYAQRFVSTPGTHDGLYWNAADGEEQSPMGPLFAAAREEGYGQEPLGGNPTPYHGYFFRILTGQGANAPGGAVDYVVAGRMIGGFALVASPARYGSSGVMTFIVSQDGVVYEKDFGKHARKAVQAIKVFDPDTTWKKVE